MSATNGVPFEELAKITANNKCFECGALTTQWVSVNNGIFLCDKCAVIHKDFGPNISSVRSTTNDPWSTVHIAMMVNGGNEKLKEYFEKYYIPKDGPLDYKYRTKAGVHYRKLLRAVSENLFIPEALDPTEALQIDDSIDPHAVPDSDIGFESRTVVKEENSMENLKKMMEVSYEQTVQVTLETGRKLNEKLRDPTTLNELKEGMVNVGNAIVTETNNYANIINEKINDPVFKQNMKELGDKISEGARKSFSSTISFFKRLSLIDDRPNFDDYETVYNAEPYKGDSILFKLHEQNSERVPEIRLKEDVKNEKRHVNTRELRMAHEEITSLDSPTTY